MRNIIVNSNSSQHTILSTRRMRLKGRKMIIKNINVDPVFLPTDETITVTANIIEMNTNITSCNSIDELSEQLQTIRVERNEPNIELQPARTGFTDKLNFSSTNIKTGNEGFYDSRMLAGTLFEKDDHIDFLVSTVQGDFALGVIHKSDSLLLHEKFEAFALFESNLGQYTISRLSHDFLSTGNSCISGNVRVKWAQSGRIEVYTTSNPNEMLAYSIKNYEIPPNIWVSAKRNGFSMANPTYNLSQGLSNDIHFSNSGWHSNYLQYNLSVNDTAPSGKMVFVAQNPNDLLSIKIETADVPFEIFSGETRIGIVDPSQNFPQTFVSSSHYLEIRHNGISSSNNIIAKIAPLKPLESENKKIELKQLPDGRIKLSKVESFDVSYSIGLKERLYLPAPSFQDEIIGTKPVKNDSSDRTVYITTNLAINTTYVSEINRFVKLLCIIRNNKIISMDAIALRDVDAFTIFCQVLQNGELIPYRKSRFFLQIEIV